MQSTTESPDMITASELKPERQLMGHQFSTYRIGGPIEEAYQPASVEEAVAVLQNIYQKDGIQKPLTVLGWGGNTLIASAGISGLTLITRKMTWVHPLGNFRFEFGAGVHLAKVAATALQQSLTGAEFTIGIPGTVGGAIRMNAGAMRQETQNVIESVTLYNLEKRQLETWEPEALGFAYRKSNIDPQKVVVLSAVMGFEKGDKDQIKAKMDENVQFRKSHHPIEPNGGSVFQNPLPDKPAGMLLDKLGAKSWVEGGVRISPLHANFIINHDNGSSLDVLRLMRRMQLAIWEHYQLSTHPENKFMGDATAEEASLWQALTQAP